METRDGFSLDTNHIQTNEDNFYEIVLKCSQHRSDVVMGSFQRGDETLSMKAKSVHIRILKETTNLSRNKARPRAGSGLSRHRNDDVND